MQPPSKFLSPDRHPEAMQKEVPNLQTSQDRLVEGRGSKVARICRLSLPLLCHMRSSFL